MIMRNELVKIESKIIYGVTTITSNCNEQKEETAKIGALWQKFMTDIQPHLSDSANIYAVYSHYRSDVNGEYQVLVGSDEKSISSTHQQEIDSGWYRRFSAQGAFPEITIRLWQEIWRFYQKNSHEKRAYQTDFESYDAVDTVSIYIGVLNPHDSE